MPQLAVHLARPLRAPGVTQPPSGNDTGAYSPRETLTAPPRAIQTFPGWLHIAALDQPLRPYLVVR
jgi:hypothetical protein